MLKPLNNNQFFYLPSIQKEPVTNKTGDISLFFSAAEKKDTGTLDKSTLEFAAKAEKIQKTSEEKMAKTVKMIKEKMTENVIEQILVKKLNSKVDDLSAISFNPINITDSPNEGLFSINYNITQDGVSVDISLFNISIELHQNINIKISQNLLSKKAKEYLVNNNFLNEIQKMQAGESVVLEETPDSQHLPVVTASKDKNGNVILDIDKNGIKVRVSISQEELKPSGSEKIKEEPKDSKE